jgi:squalene-hopene/tetraprenyl-beta-curcumene cyclase
VPAGAGIAELRVERRSPARRGFQFRPKERFWRLAFDAIDRTLKTLETLDWRPFRRQGLKQAEAWILERLEKSDGLGAIFPPIVNTILALRCLGYPADHPAVADQAAELEKLELEDEGTIRVQPCFSSVWDTALAMVALQESGSPTDDPKLRRAASWLLDREVRSPGDWKRNLPDTAPGGWYFEYANEFYPDADDTAEVLTALAGVCFDDANEEARRQGALERGLAWQLAMQNSDGGWGAFDRECTDEVLTYIPFADHNAMIDPSCEDITGRTLEALEKLGFPPEHSAVARAVGFLDAKQEEDGTWYGRWGCNYIYGTWLAVRGLKCAGEDLSLEKRQRAVSWLHRHQNEDGGWGELPCSYDDPRQKGVGPSTPSQTAWALMALLALGDGESPRVLRAVRYLLANQQYDGSWQDRYWTGTGFPKVFYLRYHLYATYFPLWALSAWARANAESIELSSEDLHGAAVRRPDPRGFEVTG